MHSIKRSDLIAVYLQQHLWKLLLNWEISALLLPVLCVWQNNIRIRNGNKNVPITSAVASSVLNKVRHGCKEKGNCSFHCNVSECIRSQKITEFKEEWSPCWLFLLSGLGIAFALAHSYNLETGIITIQQKILFLFLCITDVTSGWGSPQNGSNAQFLPEHLDVLFLEPSSTTAASTSPEHAVFSQCWECRSLCIRVCWYHLWFLGLCNMWHN